MPDRCVGCKVNAAVNICNRCFEHKFCALCSPIRGQAHLLICGKRDREEEDEASATIKKPATFYHVDKKQWKIGIDYLALHPDNEVEKVKPEKYGSVIVNYWLRRKRNELTEKYYTDNGVDFEKHLDSIQKGHVLDQLEIAYARVRRKKRWWPPRNRKQIYDALKNQTNRKVKDAEPKKSKPDIVSEEEEEEEEEEQNPRRQSQRQRKPVSYVEPDEEVQIAPSPDTNVRDRPPRKSGSFRLS